MEIGYLVLPAMLSGGSVSFPTKTSKNSQHKSKLYKIALKKKIKVKENYQQK